MTIKCLLSTVHKPNIQQGTARCNKTMNKYVTKTGENITEVICDFGKGLKTKSEISNYGSKIKQTLTDGSTITYTKNRAGDVLIKEGAQEYISKNPNLWKNLVSLIYKGFQ
jgi:hypothetical protein